MLRVRNTIQTFSWCLALSWQASKFYTILRLLVEIATPLLAILLAYLGRNVINALAGQGSEAIIGWDLPTEQYLIFLLCGVFVVGLVQAVARKVTQYCQSMHEEMLRGRISLVIMEHGFSADLEHFDNPDYHDKLQAATQDSHATMYVVWNALSCVSATVSFFSVFMILFQANPWYGIVITITAIPASIVTARYTKLLYGLSLEQINGLRQMGYSQFLAIDKRYVQELRLFQAGEKLKSRYFRIWNELFQERKKVTRKRTITTTLLELLPEIAILWIAIHIAFRVLAGETMIGDYSFFIGLIAQLLGAITMLSSSLMNIYDNKMQMENYKSIENYKNSIADTGTKVLQRVDSIDFENVSFRYPMTKFAALDGVSFSLKKEEKLLS